MRGNITILKQHEVFLASAITHNGTFHADDVLSTVLLSKVFDEVLLCRTSTIPEGIPGDVIVFDIGGGKFDHHQKDFDEKRENGIKYASFGLLWKEYGIRLLKKIKAPNVFSTFWKFDRMFVQPIDAVDNGQVPPEENNLVKQMTLSRLIKLLNTTWDSHKEPDEMFFQAFMVAEVFFDNALRKIISAEKSKTMVVEAIEMQNEGILELEYPVPWVKILLDSLSPKAKEIKFAVIPSYRGGYSVQVVPKYKGLKTELRKQFPKQWLGLRDQELINKTGIETAEFCHPEGFICTAKTYDGAIALAKKAIAIPD